MLSVKWGKDAFACCSEYEQGICMNHQKCNNIYWDLYIFVEGCNLLSFLSIFFYLKKLSAKKPCKYDVNVKK